MSWYKPSTLFDKVFEGGLIIKGIDGFVEFVSGLVLVFVSPHSIQHFLSAVTQRELSSDPNDKFAHLILHSADSLNSGNKLFLIIYLWIHAGIKLIAVIGILKNWLWAYPFSLITLGILMLYQLYAIYVKTSVGLILLTAFDVFILFMIWREYSKVKANRKHSDTPAAKKA